MIEHDVCLISHSYYVIVLRVLKPIDSNTCLKKTVLINLSHVFSYHVCVY